ncbi:hypothetical protein MYAM1_002435 [Malassezia yamatoensis]|uniref:PITH domain-containing protein n=1 Tax=Malassezia yamatoensis TaxID=253288 RepID=A0AAJ5YT21_9BASI|nr:hypothetical protein MYAM1_002435 [Malassezia yamatoensis]
MQCGGDATALDRGDAASMGSSTAAYGDAHNLYTYIDRDKVYGLNIEPPESAKNVIKPWDQRLSLEVWVESGVDDQRCTLFVNRPHGVDFEQAAAAISARPGRDLGPAGSGLPQADFSLLERTAGVTAYPLSVSRFAQTHSISVMLVGKRKLTKSDSPTQQTSRVFYLGFIGKALDLRQDSTIRHDVPAANSSTHAVDGVADKQGAASTPSVR